MHRMPKNIKCRTICGDDNLIVIFLFIPGEGGGENQRWLKKH